MRSVTAAQQRVLDSGTQAEHVRVLIRDAGGTIRDLTTYVPDFNPVKSVQWKESVNDPGMTAEITLAREFYKSSLSPYMEASGLNHELDPDASFAALIAVNREIWVDVAITHIDRTPESGDWMTVFHGRTDTVDAASGENVTVSCRGLQGRLQQQYIKQEIVYAYTTDLNPFSPTYGQALPLHIWEPGMAVTVFPPFYCLPASRGDDDPGKDKFLACSQAGTTGSTEPVWTTGANQVDGTAKWDYLGGPTASGTPVEEVIQNILDDNIGTGDTSPTLLVPSSPSWAIRQFIQKRTFTWDAIKALANQIGWDIRYKWDSGSSAFRLTLYEPDRSSPSVDHVFGTSDYAEPTRLAVSLADIRNVVRVIYGDRADLWPGGIPKRKTVEVSDSASITKYGELWCEIQEGETSNIDTSTEASALANAALSDMKEPTAELTVPLVRGWPFVEVNDYYTFTADGVRFDSDQSLAVVGWTQTYESSGDGKACLRTSLELRGMPTIGARAHINKQQHPRNPAQFDGHLRLNFQGEKTPALSFTDAVGGTQIAISIGNKDKTSLLEEFEIHVSDAPSFSPDESTLAAVTKSLGVTVPDLIPGKEYYVQAVPRYFNSEKIIRGQPSAEVSFVAGRASSGHIHEGIALIEAPLNGGFETRTDPNGPPDHWTVMNGSWGSDFDVVEDGNGVSGGRYLQVVSQASLTKIRSAFIPLVNDAADGSTRATNRYRLTAWVKTDAGNSGANNLFIVAAGIAYDGTLIGAMGGSGSLFVNAASKLGKWQKVECFVHTDSFATMRGVYIYIYQDTTGSHPQTYYVDELRLTPIGTGWHAVGNTSDYTDNYEALPAFGTGWSNYGSGSEACAFRKDRAGRVYIKGLAVSSTHTTGTGNKVFVLPVGYRPSELIHLASTGNGKFAQLEIDTSGNVYCGAADSATYAAYFSIDCSFETF